MRQQACLARGEARLAAPPTALLLSQLNPPLHFGTRHVLSFFFLLLLSPKSKSNLSRKLTQGPPVSGLDCLPAYLPAGAGLHLAVRLGCYTTQRRLRTAKITRSDLRCARRVHFHERSSRASHQYKPGARPKSMFALLCPCPEGSLRSYSERHVLRKRGTGEGCGP